MLSRSLGLRASRLAFSPASASLSTRFASAKPAPAAAGGYAPPSDVGGPAPKPSDAPAAQLPAKIVPRDMKISNPRTSKKERLIILGSGWGGFTLVRFHSLEGGELGGRRGQLAARSFARVWEWSTPLPCTLERVVVVLSRDTERDRGIRGARKNRC